MLGFFGTACRWALMITGGGVWLWLVYEWYDPDGADDLLYGPEDGSAYDREARRFYGVSESGWSNETRLELDAKDKALFALVQKLETQPDVQRVIGQGVTSMWPSSVWPSGDAIFTGTMRSDAWRPTFLLNGPQGCCAVKVVMRKNHLGEWVPVSVVVEQMALSNRLVEAEGELPHGLAYVNRFAPASWAVSDAAQPSRAGDSPSRRTG